MVNNLHETLFEASRLSITDKVIFTDKTPKSLFEYYINGYTEKDIMTLIENLRMDFEVWDKTYNFYATSKAITEISSNDISVLYEDSYGNAFIYSFAKKKVFYYDKSNPSFININEGLSIAEFLLCARRDFEALLRTPYGKKYVTESSVVTEGIKEFFGFGKALRIYIDQRDKSNNNRFALDEHTYACIDALLHYQKDMISVSDYRKILGRQNTLLQVFVNRDLGRRDLLRRMKVNIPPEEDVICSFGDILKRFGQEEDRIYNAYYKAKSFQLSVLNAKPLIEKFFKKNPVIGNCARIVVCDLYDKKMTLDNVAANALAICSPYEVSVMEFNLSSFSHAYMASINNRFQRFKNEDIHQKFLYYIDSIINILNASDKTNTWVFHADFDVPEEEAKNNCKGTCSIIPLPASTYSSSEHYSYSPSAPSNGGSKALFGDKFLFEYFAGKDYETYYQDLIKEQYGIPHTEEDEVSNISLEGTVFDENFNLLVPEVYLENSLKILFEANEPDNNRSLGRKIAHGVRDGVEALKRGIGNVARVTKDLSDPVGKAAREFIDGFGEANKEEQREILITGSTYLKLKKFFKDYVLPAVCLKAYLTPWKFYLIAVGYLIRWCFKDPDNTEARDKVTRELETELKLVREKIEDAKSDNNRKAKYQLMRMESKLEDEIARIKYNSKS